MALASCPTGVRAEPETAPVVQFAKGPVQPDSGSIAVRCGTLIDGLTGALRTGLTVLIRNGWIEVLSTDAETPPGMPLLDLGGYTCLPGLIDMHTHITDRPGDSADLSVFYRRRPEEQLQNGRESAAATLAPGRFGDLIAVRDDPLRDIRRLQDGAVVIKGGLVFKQP